VELFATSRLRAASSTTHTTPRQIAVSSVAHLRSRVNRSLELQSTFQEAL